MIERFIQTLKIARTNLDYRQIEETLWLARFLPAPATEETPAEIEAGEQSSDRPPAQDDVTPAESPKHPPATPAAAPAAEKVFASSASATAVKKTAASKIRVPTVAALPGALEITRALRPLARRAKSKREFVLDEERTVELSAKLNLVSPVFKPAPERWFEIALVVDDSPTMAVWRDTVAELAQLLERQGAFRDVRRFSLRVESGEAYLATSSSTRLRPKALNDPAARRLVVVVTDGVSEHWRDGALALPLVEWAGTMPVVIVQTLGVSLWRHTLLGEPAATIESLLPGQPNRSLRVALPAWEMGALGERAPFPVVPLNAELIGQWAHLVAQPGGSFSAVLLDPTPRRDAVASIAKVDEELTPRERLKRYREMVSNEAYDLAVFLSVMPLTWNVMRLVHEAMIPSPRLEHLAEFLNGGIVRRNPPAKAEGEEKIEYDFYPGLRQRLERSIRSDELDRIFRAISREIGQRIGSTREFVAWIRDPQGESTLDAAARHFEIALPALERLGYGYLLEEVEQERQLRVAQAEQAIAPDQPLNQTPKQTNETIAADAPSPKTIPPAPSVPSSLSALLEVALQGKLGSAEVAELAAQLRKMTAVEVTSLIREAGITHAGDRFSRMAGGTEIGTYLVSQATQEIHDLLLEADRRCQVVKSPEAIKKMIPLRGLNSRLIAETERVNQLVRETAAGTRSSSLTMATSDQRTATLRTALDLYAEFPDGVLIVEANRQPITHSEAMLACALPFVELGENLTAKNELLLISRFQETLRERRRLIILDQIPNAAEMGFIPHLPPGCALVIVESRAAESKPSRDALESQLRQLRAEYGDVVARLRQAEKETDLRRMPAPAMLENWKAQRKTLLQDIRKLEAQIAALNRDPQKTLDELMERALQSINQSGNGPIETFIQDFRQLESNASFDPGQLAALMNIALMNIALEYLRLNDPATAREFCEFALEKTMGNPILDQHIFLVLASAFSLMKDLRLAETMLRQAVESAEAAADTVGQAHANSALGDLLLQVNDPRGAQERYKEALTQFRSVKSVREELHILVKLAEAAAAAGEQPLARKFAEQALEMFKDLELPDADRLRQRLERLRAQPDFSSFTYETLTLDARGKEVKDSRRTLSTRQFTEELSDGINLEMVEIPGGTFTMGAPESEAERWDGETQHEVTVSPFYIGKFTVTQAQWRTVAGWPKVERDLEPETSRFKGKPDSDLRPVEQVSWEDAKEFCARLSQKTGRAYRLPTEAEWEYACRAGTTTPFAFGETITHEIANYDSEYPYAKAKGQKSRGETVPVGSLPSITAPVANAFGLYDMHGNVWEWCEDWYGDYHSEPQTDPAGPETGQYRVLRGGSWVNYSRSCRSANRGSDAPLNRLNYFGFRVVCVSARTS